LSLIARFNFNKMGQLEAYGINEMYLSGVMIALFSTYIAEEYEADAFESFKPYFYSAALSCKQKKLVPVNLLVSEPDDGQFMLHSLYGVEWGFITMTKVLGDYPLFQRHVKPNDKIEEQDADLKEDLLLLE